MTFVISILLLGAFVWCSLIYQSQLPEKEPMLARRWISLWGIRGLAVPIVIWVFFNLGLHSHLPPLMPAIEAARMASGPWVPTFLEMTGRAILVISSFWTGLTLCWFVVTVVSPSEQRREYLIGGALWGMLLLPVVALIYHYTGLWGMGVMLILWVLPLLHYFLPEVARTAGPPVYARAVAKLKAGKYRDAEWEVIQELENHEDDFEGWMMLAELYAVQFHDLQTATNTVREICDQPEATPSHVSVALQRLADWQLNIAQNPAGARNALAEIVNRLPGTHLAHMAQLRINQLPTNREDWLQQRSRRIRLPALSDNAVPDTASQSMSLQEAQKRAAQCTVKLESNPNDPMAREEYARLMAENLDQLDLGIAQLGLVLSLPDQPDTKRAEWLALQASWYFKQRADSEDGRELLHKLIREFPQTSQAFAAQRRLSLIETEQRMRRARAAAVRPGAPSTERARNIGSVS